MTQRINDTDLAEMQDHALMAESSGFQTVTCHASVLVALLRELREARRRVEAHRAWASHVAIDPDTIEALTTLALDATPGPRQVRHSGTLDQIELTEMGVSLVRAHDEDLYWHTVHDRDFTAAFNRDVALSLLAEVHAARDFGSRVTVAIERSHQNRTQSVELSLNTLLEDLSS